MNRAMPISPSFREDHLDDYQKLSAEQILIWLEETNRFFREIAIPVKQKAIPEKLRRGEI
jgi:hypothetical protein